MGIWIFYLLALIPIGVGAVLWVRSKEITWAEWLIGSVAGLIMAVIFQFASVAGMTSDIETWSGQITHAIHWPQWVEEYQQMHTRQVACGTDKDGNTQYTTEIYYTTEYRTHPEEWIAYTNIEDEHEISASFFGEIVANFGGRITTERPHKGGFYSGDPNSYVAYNKTGYIYPVTTIRKWENRIKAAPSLFSFSKVPEKSDAYEWPDNPDWLHSGRLLGLSQKDFNLIDLDRMNARLGPRKHVNVIIVGFGAKDSSVAEEQRSKWIGGKKNDLVICYGNSWCKVFGWSDSEICKRDIETIMLERGPDTLAKIETEITRGYHIKDWSMFDYITIEPPTWSYWVFLIVLACVQGGFYFWAYTNDDRKDGCKPRWEYP